MAIRYAVFQNPLQEGQYYPRPVSENTRTLDTLIRNISQKCTLSPADIQAVILAFIQEMIDGLLDGDRITIDGLANFSVRLSQVMTAITDRFDFGQGGQLRVSTTVHPAVTSAIRAQATFEKLNLPARQPLLVNFFDVASQQSGVYTTGSIGQVTGENLKIGDLGAADQGIFFISTPGGTETAVQVIQNNGDRKLVFEIPNGLAGNQRLVVRTRYASTGALRSGELTEPLLPA
ncbi:MAG: hypothetical protein HJJLKODD_00049 [Phycisphaerae bacterium]|nr:hypothetical protein [Phycisphaerae bacterium]